MTIPLATLLGLAERPGEAAGFGPLDPALARAMATAAATHPATTWCLTVTDQDGHPTAHGCARPTRRAGPGPGPDRGTGPAPVAGEADKPPGHRQQEPVRPASPAGSAGSDPAAGTVALKTGHPVGTAGMESGGSGLRTMGRT